MLDLSIYIFVSALGGGFITGLLVRSAVKFLRGTTKHEFD